MVGTRDSGELGGGGRDSASVFFVALSTDDGRDNIELGGGWDSVALSVRHTRAWFLQHVGQLFTKLSSN